MLFGAIGFQSIQHFGTCFTFGRSRRRLEEENERLEEGMLERALELEATNRDLLGEMLECRRREEENTRLQEQLIEAQKMEAIGRLAGGVAHDFNNLLTGILGYTDQALGELDPESEPAKDLVQVKRAGSRAAELTGQLLAFSRRQNLQPRVVRLNEVIEDVIRLLGRVLGEDIELVAKLDPEVEWIKIDPGRLEQVMLNLAVNARDAMPNGGRLTIGTANSWLEASPKADPEDLAGGPHALIMVSDTGRGMDEATREMIFEPFFATKEETKGTGLGLSMVFGTVKQSGGHLWVDSAPGQGAEFKLYFPSVDEEGDRIVIETQSAAPDPSADSPVVLLVEDEPLVRGFAAGVLRRRGYKVLEASGGEEALGIFEADAGRIGLVFIDVAMAGMNGVDLGRRIRSRSPKTRIVFATGYAGDPLAPDLRELDEADLLHKPFSEEQILEKIGAVASAPTNG